MGIMVYHYCSWGLGHFPAETFLGRVGVYGVSLFYVLSGLTLYYVYYDKMKPNWRDQKDFFTKRFFRIFPLLWLTTVLTIATRYPTDGIPSPYILFINFTGLFGFIDWTNYIGTGVWSIGNELVFYLFFPFFILFAKKAKWAFWIFSFLIAAVYVYFAFIVLDPNIPTEPQKANYINPLNQVFLFLGGFLIGYLFKKLQPPNYVSLILLVVSLTAFILIPAKGDSISLVTGINRILFTLICFTICFSFYKLHFRLPGIIDKGLTKLGEASYSVYLIHPIVWAVLSFTSKKLMAAGINFPVELRIGICFVLALITSYLIYITYEKFFIGLGKKWSKKPGT